MILFSTLFLIKSSDNSNNKLLNVLSEIMNIKKKFVATNIKTKCADDNVDDVNDGGNLHSKIYTKKKLQTKICQHIKNY